LDSNVTWKFAEKARSHPRPKNNPDHDNRDTYDNQKFSELRHLAMSVDDPSVSSAALSGAGFGESTSAASSFAA
jgi:hypothetical protein